MTWLLGLVVSGAALAVGAMHTTAVVVVSLAVVGTLAVATATKLVAARPPLPVVVLALLAAYSLLQALPLPSSIVTALAAQNASIWRGANELLGEAPPAWLPISLDPQASVVEGLKWFSYAVVFWLSATLARRGHPEAGPTIVFCSALLIAFVTLGHRLARAEAVYGIYHPVGEFARTSIGPLLNPNNLASYVNLGAFCGFGLMISNRPRAPRWLIGLGLAPLLAMGVETRSRGALVGLFIGVALLLPALWRMTPKLAQGRPARRTTVAAIGVVVAGAFVLAWLAQAPSGGELAQQDIRKLALARWVLPMVRDHLWLGVGRGAFESVFQSYVIGKNNLIYSHPENFLVQWLAEWGLLVAAGALLALGVSLVRQAKLAWHSRRALCGLAGMAALLIQNMVDLGLEVPAIALAAAVILGSLWRADPRQGPAGAVSRPAERYQRLAWAAVAVGSVLAVAVAWSKPETVGDVRRRLLSQWEALGQADAAGVAKFRDELRASIRKYPAEPYLPRLGALLAFRQHENPIPWINRALELGLTSGRSHYLLARMLQSWKRDDQALLELRFAATYDPELSDTTARLALEMTRAPAKLLRAAPPGEDGVAYLLALGKHAAGEGSSQLRLAVLREAAKRDTGSEARIALARAQLAMLKLPPEAESGCAGEQREICIDEVRKGGELILRTAPTSAVGPEILGELWLLLGRAEEAEQLLARRCPDVVARRPCMLRWLEAAAGTGDPRRVDNAARALSTETCSTTTDCGRLNHSIADVLIRAKRQSWALPYLVRAAREDGTRERWLRVADVAEELGEHAVAIDALTIVVSRASRPEPKLMGRLERVRTKAFLLPKGLTY